MRRSLEVGGVQAEDTKSQDFEMKTSWTSLRNNKSSVAGSLQAKGIVIHGARYQGWKAMAKSTHFIPQTMGNHCRVENRGMETQHHWVLKAC